MKIIRLLCLVILCFKIHIVNSQNAICGTIDAPTNLNNLPLVMSRSSGTVCVNIFFHVVRNDNQTGGYNPANLTQIIQRLNLRYNSHGIFLKNLGYDFIDNSAYLDLDDDLQANLLFNEHVRQNAINFYLVNSGPWNGRAIRPENKMIVINGAALSSTSEHELGHCFDLYHTHEYDNGVEHIQRTGNNANCTTAGDRLCATPADPGLAYAVNGVTYYKVDFNCNYNGTDPDPIPGGNLIYTPDGNNIMSFSRPSCRVQFLVEQGDRMYNAIQTNPILQATISTSCQLPYIVGPSSICGDAIKTYTFNYSNNNSNTVNSWSVSSNMVIVSQTPAQLQVKRAPGQTGVGTITAQINGYNVFKEVQLTGVPNISNNAIQGVGSSVNIYSTVNLTVNSATNATSYQWSIVNDYNNCPGGSNKPMFPDFNNSTQATTTTPNIWINFRSCLGTFRLRCKAINSCGSVFYMDKEVTVVNDPCPQDLTLTPNPASDDFTADVMGPAPCRVGQPSDKSKGQITYAIYTSNGILVFKKEKANPQETMSVRGFKKGIYYVEAILPDNQRVAKPLIVN